MNKPKMCWHFLLSTVLTENKCNYFICYFLSSYCLCFKFDTLCLLSLGKPPGGTEVRGSSALHNSSVIILFIPGPVKDFRCGRSYFPRSSFILKLEVYKDY